MYLEFSVHSHFYLQIAPMLTVKREREIEQGINKRLSRKLDRKWKQSIVVRPPPSLRGNKEE
jgi:large subunit ribosomal protein L29